MTTISRTIQNVFFVPRLAQELFLYSAGLFPLLSHASMSARSHLLTVYETHFVPLGERLRPALNGLLSGVLPGLEEGSDHFDRTNKLLESVCEASHPSVFYGALWECVASNQSVRLPALTFVLAHISKKGRRPAGGSEGSGGEATPVCVRQSYLLGNDVGVMVRAVCQAVQDSSAPSVAVLVQRNALDLLLTMFPVHEKTLGEADMVALVTAACSVLLRRDMSLNRRLFTWLLGPNAEVGGGRSPLKRAAMGRQESVSSVTSSDESGLPTYFDFYSHELLVEGVRAILRNSLVSSKGDQMPDLKPFRLLVTLLDKAEIGPVIMDDIIIDVFRTMYHSYHTERGREVSTGNGHRRNWGKKEDGGVATLARQQRKGRQELIKSANLLFGTFDSSYIWDFCGGAFERAAAKKRRINDTHACDVNEIGSDPSSTVIEMSAIIDFLLDIVSIETYVETHSEHLPSLFRKVVTVLSERCDVFTAKEVTKGLSLAKKLLSKVQPAWNAWDVAKETQQLDSADAKSDVTTSNSGESAAEVWNELGRENLTSPAPSNEGSNAEVGREATESLSPLSSSKTSPPPPAPMPAERQTSQASRMHQAHERLMQECSSAFQEFFVRLMSSRVFPSGFHVDHYVSRMVHRPNDTLDDRTRNLEHLLQDSEPVLDVQNEEAVEKAIAGLKSLDLPLRSEERGSEEIEELSEALAITCQILVDLSTIPTVSTRSASDADEQSECGK